MQLINAWLNFDHSFQTDDKSKNTFQHMLPATVCWKHVLIRNKHKRKYFSIEFPERKILSHSHNKNASASLKMFLVCLIAEMKSASKHVKREIYNPKEPSKVK